MQGLKKEILEIPEKAGLCYSKTKKVSLPKKVPYIGMGTSYYSSLTLKYSGVDIQPEIASEFFNLGKKYSKGVLISQSGETSETFWCKKLFKKRIAIVNNVNSSIAKNTKVIDILAGKEKFSSTKTYVNTLITLYNGFGIDTRKAIDKIKKDMKKYDVFGKKAAKIISRKIKGKKVKAFYIIGSGPNAVTAQQSALVLSETLKYGITGLSLGQYDHGPKETAKDSIVIVLNVKGPSYKRTKKLVTKIKKKGAEVIYIEEDIKEIISPLVMIMPINFLMYYLTIELRIKNPFIVGSKITKVK